MNILKDVYKILDTDSIETLVQGVKDLNRSTDLSDKFNNGDIVANIDGMLNESKSSLYSVIGRAGDTSSTSYIIEDINGSRYVMPASSITVIDEGIIGSVAKFGVKALGKTLGLASKPVGWLAKKTGGAIAQKVKHKYISRVPSLNKLMGQKVSEPKFSLITVKAPFYSGFNTKTKSGGAGGKVGARKKMLVLRASVLASRIAMEDQNSIIRAVKQVDEHLGELLWSKQYTPNSEHELHNAQTQANAESGITNSEDVATELDGDAVDNAKAKMINQSFNHEMKLQVLINEESIDYSKLAREIEGRGKVTSDRLDSSDKDKKYGKMFHKTEYIILKEDENIRENRKYFWFRVNMSVYIIPDIEGNYIIHFTNPDTKKGVSYRLTEMGKSQEDKEMLALVKNIMIESFNTMGSEFMSLN